MIKNKLRLYLIMGSMNAGMTDPLNTLEAALRGGITCFQLREKGPGALVGDELMSFAKACQKLCRQYDVPFIINDDVNLAIAIDADGIHIGQDDESAQSVVERLGKNKILGVSTHTEKEVLAAIAAEANYVGIGPVYATSSKADAKPVAGTAFIQEIANTYPELPIVGIGGITLLNFSPVLAAGAAGISVISAIAAADDPYVAARDFHEAIVESVTV